MKYGRSVGRSVVVGGGGGSGCRWVGRPLVDVQAVKCCLAKFSVVGPSAVLLVRYSVSSSARQDKTRHPETPKPWTPKPQKP